MGLEACCMDFDELQPWGISLVSALIATIKASVSNLLVQNSGDVILFGYLAFRLCRALRYRRYCLWTATT